MTELWLVAARGTHTSSLIPVRRQNVKGKFQGEACKLQSIIGHSSLAWFNVIVRCNFIMTRHATGQFKLIVFQIFCSLLVNKNNLQKENILHCGLASN